MLEKPRGREEQLQQDSEANTGPRAEDLTYSHLAPLYNNVMRTSRGDQATADALDEFFDVLRSQYGDNLGPADASEKLSEESLSAWKKVELAIKKANDTK